MNGLTAFIKLIRPRYTAQVVGTVALFTIANHGLSEHSIYAILSTLFLSIAVFFFDDARDYMSDLIVHPHRPIVEKRLSIRQTYVTGIILLLIGILMASRLFFYQLAIYLVSLLASTLIIFFNLSSILKALLSSFLIGACLPFAAFPDAKTLLFSALIALPHFGGQIVKDFLHSYGDKIQGFKPPKQWLKYLASTTFLIASAILWLPWILHFVTWIYLPPILLTFTSCILLGLSVLMNRFEKVYLYGGIGMCSTLSALLLDILVSNL